MKRLTEQEERALEWLSMNEPVNVHHVPYADATLKGLVKAKYVRAEPTDDGLSYSLDRAGREFIYRSLIEG